MKRTPLDISNYASNVLGAAEYALDARAAWEPHNKVTSSAFDRGLAVGHIAAFSAMLDLLLGTRDETEARAKLERIG